MKTLLLALFLFPVFAFAEAPDHLKKFANAAEFCNLLEKAKGLPETNTSCGAILQLATQDFQEADPKEFGKIRDVIELSAGDFVFVVTTLTLEELEALRHDQRIIRLAPDFPMGGNGSFTVRN